MRESFLSPHSDRRIDNSKPLEKRERNVGHLRFSAASMWGHSDTSLSRRRIERERDDKNRTWRGKMARLKREGAQADVRRTSLKRGSGSRSRVFRNRAKGEQIRGGGAGWTIGKKNFCQRIWGIAYGLTDSERKARGEEKRGEERGFTKFHLRRKKSMRDWARGALIEKKHCDMTYSDRLKRGPYRSSFPADKAGRNSKMGSG